MLSETTKDYIKQAKALGLTFKECMNMAWKSAGEKATPEFMEAKDFIESVYGQAFSTKKVMLPVIAELMRRASQNTK